MDITETKKHSLGNVLQYKKTFKPTINLARKPDRNQDIDCMSRCLIYIFFFVIFCLQYFPDFGICYRFEKKSIRSRKKQCILRKKFVRLLFHAYSELHSHIF